MPRDDLSIDFVKKMPPGEPLDPGLILDDFVNRVQNLPEEIRFLNDEIADKDRQVAECVRIIEDRDNKIQKWIKTNGSHVPNPKEAVLRQQIREQFEKADQLSQDKITLTQRMQLNFDKQTRALDAQIKLLYDRGEPGFTDPDEVPSLLRPSAANHTAPSARAINPSNMVTAASPSPLLRTTPSSIGHPATARLPNNPQARQFQAQQQVAQQHAASAPTTPAASIILNRNQRESSAGPTPKRGPRAGPGLANAPTASSGLARHASLGPGTPKGVTGPGSVARAGSAGPRAASTKAANGGGSRRGTPTATSKKKSANKSNLSRVKKASSRNSPASTADSELSDAESGSGDDDATEARLRGASGDGKDEDGDENLDDAEDEDEEDAGDDKKYCLCHNISYGDMVACDNDNCPYEWFHWSCVGLKSEPTGKWFCPMCEGKRKGK